MPTLAKKRKTEWDIMMKNAIFEATMAVLSEHGFEGLRMDRVAKAAEVSTGTLYNYFKNKDELLLHVMDSLFIGVDKNEYCTGYPIPPAFAGCLISSTAF